ncbi:TonB-dependent receptor plug domain protein [Verrucomicrobiia bacterium DG1235]|nr:TonB-dependent receptor plug domain protein [Verrucomicrobiae bacterium DG1235]
MKPYSQLTRMKRLRGYRLAIYALAATATASTGFAQDEDDEEVFTLSPFEVNASEDEGYRATNTLAGSRINTSLKDVAASISVVTEAFIEDVGAVDLNDILVYTGNTESTKNYTAAGQFGTNDNVANNPQNQNRVRGIGSADLTRDYFRSIGQNVGVDSYNVERVTINRGPNSILYGLGNPTGVVNYSTKHAILSEDSNEVGIRIGSNSDLRGTFDFNRVLADETFAIRLLGLVSDRGFEQQPSHFKDRRLNLAATYRPFENTTLKFNYEKVDQKQNHPNTITPLDHVTEWVEQGRPAWDAANDDYWNGPGYLTRVQSDTQVAIINSDGTPDHFFIGGAGDNYWAAVTQQSSGADIWTETAFSDNSVAPFHDMNLNPNIYNQDMDAFGFSWDQKLAEDLYLNVGYVKEDLSYDGLSFTRGFAIYVDNNTTLPDGTTNPHFGETYIPQRTLDSKSAGENGNEMIRATMTYELDLAGKADNKWFGRHNFTALAERQESDYLSNVFNEIREDTPSYLDASNRADSENWQITRIRYLGGTADSQATIAPVSPVLEPDGVPYTYYNWDTSSWATDTYNSMFTTKRRDLGSTVIESSGLIWQSYWLDNMIVGTAGWRKDKATAAQGTYNAIGSDGLVELGNDTEEGDPVSGNTSTFGVVAHPTEWLSLHYNESENFQPSVGQVNMYGETVAPPAGSGKDYGFSLDLMEGKMNVRFNWYEVEQTDSRLPWGDAMQLAQWELLFMDQNVMADVAAAEGVPYTRVSTLDVGDGNIVTTADVVAEGLEIDLIYNPTQNWRFMANLSQQDAVSSNIGKSVTRFLEEALPYWQGLEGGSVWDSDITYATWGYEGNPHEFFDYFPGTRTLTYNAAEGRSNPQLREWRMNAIANYTFTDGRMKGWNMGGAVRWQDEAAIGFATIQENGLVVGLDLENPFVDEATTDLDLWAGFERQIMNDKVTMGIQLNVQNVTRKDGFQAINANSDGEETGFRIEFGPTWTLQSTFTW